jgi:hypothetical protein
VTRGEKLESDLLLSPLLLVSLLVSLTVALMSIRLSLSFIEEGHGSSKAVKRNASFVALLAAMALVSDVDGRARGRLIVIQRSGGGWRQQKKL